MTKTLIKIENLHKKPFERTNESYEFDLEIKSMAVADYHPW